MSGDSGLPIHSSITVHDHEDIYRENDWWKAVVSFTIGNNDSSPRTAIYLWHKRDGEWVTKQKYRISSFDEWSWLQLIITNYFEGNPNAKSTKSPDLPISDYYRMSRGNTLYRNQKWWKAAALVCQKGDYETNEVIAYLWQKVDDEWRRRQKYSVRSLNEWEEEYPIIDGLVQFEDTSSNVGDEDLYKLEQELSELDVF